MAYSQALRKINIEAKRIRAKSPNMKYSSAVKQAGAAYRSGKLGSIGAVKKSKAKKRAPAKKKAVKKIKTGEVVTTRTSYAVGSIASARGHLVKRLEEQLSWLMMGHYNAKTKTKKRQYLKKMVPIKQQLRLLKK